jgi:hypothetical protein
MAVAATRICLACRSILVRGELCSCPAESLAPASPAGWTALTKAVWGEAAPAARVATRPSAPFASLAPPLVMITAIVLLAKTSLLTLYLDGPAAGLSIPTAWLVGGPLLWILLTPLFMWVLFRASVRSAGWSLAAARSSGPRGVALGAVGLPAALPEQRGRVRGGACLDAPISGTACVAWGLCIVLDDGSILLRDARSAGFEVELDDGRRVRIPAGRVVVDGLAASRPSPIEAADAFLLALRLRPPPPPQRVDHRDPFAGHAVHEIVFATGDELTLRAEVARVPASDEAGDYRRAARAELLVEGTAVLIPGRGQLSPPLPI